MTPRAAFTVALLVSGCATAPLPQHQWVPDAAMPACARVVWVQLPWADAARQCGHFACAAVTGSGLPDCHVVSGYSVDQAKAMRLGDGMSLYDHEARHVLKRLRHPIPARVVLLDVTAK